MKRPSVAWPLAAWLIASSGAAQSGGACVTGSVADADGLPIPHAEVAAIDPRTSARHAVRSNEVGVFELGDLPPGTYVLRVEHAGFRTLVTDPLTLGAGQAVHAPLVLHVDRVQERVLVDYRLPALQTDSAVVGQLVSGQTAAALPLSGRSIAQLALLLPGTVAIAPATLAHPKVTAQGRPYVNGHREQGNSFVLDGADLNEPLDNLLPYQPSLEALEEVRIETNNYAAEHGALAGALVHATLRSGTNRLRGSVFEFWRDERLNARRWEDKRAGGERGRESQHTFGGVLGGPLAKDKLFFFADYQGRLRDTRARMPFELAPPEWRRGDFSGLLGRTAIVDPASGQPFPGNRIPPERIHAVARRLLSDPALYPPANAPGRATVFIADDAYRQLSHQGDLKLTLSATSRDSAYLRLSYQDYETGARGRAWPALDDGAFRAPFAGGVLAAQSDNIFINWRNTGNQK